jgi:hypothetical protein
LLRYIRGMDSTNHYALVFQATRALTSEELQQRQIEIADWVKHVTDLGIRLDPRNFGATAVTFSADGGEVAAREESPGHSFNTIVFFDSPSAAQAADIARIHPGLRYGVKVEMREWTSPRQGAASQQESLPKTTSD